MNLRTKTLTLEEQASAIDMSWFEFWEAYVQGNPEALSLHLEGGDAFSFGLPHPLFNQIFRTDLQVTPAQAIVMRDAMNALGLPWFWVGLPSTQPDPLTGILTELGLIEAFSMPGMALDMEAAPPERVMPPELAIHEVTDPEGMTAFCEGVLPAYDMPLSFGTFFTNVQAFQGYFPDFPARLFYGRWEGRPVCGSLVFFGEQVAAIQCVGTVPEARGRGFANAIVRACLLAAQEAGYRYAALQASEMGEPIYRRLGFAERYRQSFFMVPPDGSG